MDWHHHFTKEADQHVEHAQNWRRDAANHEAAADGHRKAGNGKLAAHEDAMAKTAHAHADTHDGHVADYRAMAKAATEEETEKIAKAANMIVPDRVSVILPSGPVRPILRAGQRPINAQPQVDERFERLFSVEEGL